MNPEPTAILIPSRQRPASLERVIDNIRDTTPEEHTIYVVVDRSDEASQHVCADMQVTFWMDDGDYFCPRIQFLFEHSTEPWFFTGSDDIVFNERWLTEAFAVVDDDVKVVCGDDLRNPKGTNFLVNREYVMEYGGNFDTPGRVHYGEYFHNYSDDEMVSVAIYRGVYARAPLSRVESLHPTYGTAPLDETYFRMYNANSQDEATYLSRRHLWGGTDLWRSDLKWQIQPA